MFYVEAKQRYAKPLDYVLHMQRHRVGARGNATSFPLPWMSLLQELEAAEQHGNVDVAVSLPRTGQELADLVSVLIKTSEEESPQSMSRFIHQAIVRRQPDRT